MITVALTATLAISGTYFESRTCSIVAGPCHFSGEVMTDGRMAVIAISIQSGSINNQNLAGLEAAAIIRGDENLLRASQRESVIFVDSSANHGQKLALIELMKKRSKIEFGTIQSVSVAKISLSADALDANLKIDSPSGLVYKATTNGDECLVCSMPGTQWYEPLSALTSTKVATVKSHQLTKPIFGESWSRGNETAAFVGRFRW